MQQQEDKKQVYNYLLSSTKIEMKLILCNMLKYMYIRKHLLFLMTVNYGEQFIHVQELQTRKSTLTI